MEKDTQQREGHTLTESLPHRRVAPKSDTFAGKKQPPDPEIERFLHIFDQLKPHILWVVIVTIAIYDYFHPSEVFGFLVLIAVAAGSLSLPQAIDLLQGRSVLMKRSPLAEEQKVGGQLGEKAVDEQDDEPE